MIAKHKVQYSSIPIGIEFPIYGEMTIYAHGVEDAREKVKDQLEIKYFGRPRSEWRIDFCEKV